MLPAVRNRGAPGGFGEDQVSEEQLVKVKGAVAVGRQSAEAHEVLVEQPAASDATHRHRPVFGRYLGGNWRRETERSKNGKD